VSIPLLDYWLRYLQLAPIDCLYLPHTPPLHENLLFDRPSGYLSVVCRAVDNIRPSAGDDWMRQSKRESWEWRGLTDWSVVQSQPRSSIVYRGGVAPGFWRADTDSVDLMKAANGLPPVTIAERSEDSHRLSLDDPDLRDDRGL